MKIERVTHALTNLAIPRHVEHVSGDAEVSFARDPVVCASGRFVAWMGRRPGSPAGRFDVYLSDRVNDTTELLSRGHDGAAADGGSDALSISADGRYVAFASHAGNLVPDDDNGCRDVFLFDRDSGELERVTAEAGDHCSEPELSGDGRWLAFQSRDLGGESGLFLRDLQTGETERVAGVQARNADLSFDGQVMAWEEDSGVVVYERATDQRRAVKEGGWATGPQLSEDGSAFAFKGEGGLYLHADGTNRSVALDLKGEPLDQVGFFALSGDGRTVAYVAEERRVVLQRHLFSDEVQVVTREFDSGRRDYGESMHPTLNRDGSSVVLATSCRNLASEQVRVDSGREPYRIFAVDENNVVLALKEPQAPLSVEVEIYEDAVHIGDVELEVRTE